MKDGLIMINLVDFDMLWGHRNNPTGFYEELKSFDRRLLEFLELMEEGDLMIITADHGNDPTTPSTDHSREYVPILTYGPGLKKGIDIGTRETFADVGKTIMEAMSFKDCKISGTSFWSLISG